MRHNDKGMKRRILITNDDGIHADGIVRLAKAAVKFGDVWLVAPHDQRSACSHSIILTEPLEIRPIRFEVEGVNAFSCSGMPADCVRIAGKTVMDAPPDVVLSGINYGYNAATDIQYSATVGAAFEASFQGYQGVALSEEEGSGHEVTDAYLEQVLEEVIHEPHGPGMIWNVNFPGCPLSECKGIWRDRKVSQKVVYDDRYEIVEELPQGAVRYRVHGYLKCEAEEGTDYHALLCGAVSIGKIRNIC